MLIGVSRKIYPFQYLAAQDANWHIITRDLRSGYLLLFLNAISHVRLLWP